MASKAEASFSRKVAAEFVVTAALVICGPGTAAAGVIATSTGVPFSAVQLGVIALVTGPPFVARGGTLIVSEALGP